MSDIPETELATISDRNGLKTAWPVAAAVVSISVGTTIGQGVGDFAAQSFFPLLALAVLGAGTVALAKLPTASVTRTYLALAAASAVLIALLPFDRPIAKMPIETWLIFSPWRYALPPLMVHFVLIIAWPSRAAKWAGPIWAWYLISLTLWLAMLYGVIAHEAPLLDALDGLVRNRAIEPLGWAVAVAGGLAALMTGDPTASRRRAILLAVAAVMLAFGPSMLTRFFPELSEPIVGVASWESLAFALFPLVGLAAALAVPRADRVANELLGHRLATDVLGASDLANELRQVAATFRQELEADGVRIFMLQPPINVSDGETASFPPASDSIPAEAESLEERRVLVAPIGRGNQPFGEVRLGARRSGAFGEEEREWLTSVLVPVTAALRFRYREANGSNRLQLMQRESGELAKSLQSALSTMPRSPANDGMGLPPPVDASQVLAQLKSGIDAATSQGEAVERRTVLIRTRARQTSDQIARALDALHLLQSEVERLSKAGDEITSSNETVSAIAFRTNLLANNASLEATRSGAAGRTFGVLAEEIRRLADTAAGTSGAIGERTAALAREVAEMATAIQQIREALSTAISEAESVEEASRNLTDDVGLIGDSTRALTPAIEEAYAVAGRRTARDSHQNKTLEKFLVERRALADGINAHREQLEELARALEKLGLRGERRESRTEGRSEN